MTIICKTLDHSYVPYMIEMMKVINMVASFREFVGKYKALGQNSKDRVERDASSHMLLGLGRSYMALVSAQDSAKESKAKCTEELASKEGENVGSAELLQTLIVTDFLIFTDLEDHACLLADAIDAEVASRASAVEQAFEKCGELANQMQSGGTADWKTNIDSDKVDDWDHVLNVANSTLYKAGGKTVGEAITKIAEASGL